MPNRTDLADATGMPADTRGRGRVAAATALRQRHGFGAVLVTRGNDGMTLLDATGAHHFPAEAAEVFDIAGAGDTAVATLAAGARRAWNCRSRCGSPTSPPASWWENSAPRSRARPT